MIHFRITSLFILVSLTALSKEIKYPVTEIADELKKDVDLVVREDHIFFKILAKNHAIRKVKYVVTILNEKGNNYAEFHIPYDKLTKIIDISGNVYNAIGEPIKKLKNRDVTDQAAFDGVSLFSDDRIKILDLSQGTYPYTVEIEYDLEMNFLLSIPSSSWNGDRTSYQNASYQLVYPVGFPIQYKLINMGEIEPLRETDKGFEILSWSFKNLLPIKSEPLGIRQSRLLVAVPVEFEFSGYAGRRDTWENFGRWQIDLNKGRDVLPAKTIELAKEMTKGLPSVEQKTKALYEYLQNKTRYVGVQLGIGGFQPFEAQVVDDVGYGDCKALSNYMIALLNSVGIKGYYTWIYGGQNSRNIIEGITYDPFNHIVVSVPNGKDTLWLECTSQTEPFGYQGLFTGDRKALMVTEDGGKIVNTLRYSPEQNLQSRKATIILDLSGNASAKISTLYSGTQYENGGLNWTFGNSDRQRKWIEKNTEIPNFNVNSFNVKETRDKIPAALVNLDLVLNRYASVSGKRLFVTPNLMNRWKYIPEKILERKTDVVLNRNEIDTDTIQFSLPENLYPEFLPEPIKIKSKFGEYDASFKFDNGKVTYVRRMKSWKGRFPKETYNELVDFFKSVSKADNIKLVFLSKT
ncbi:MAG TPA: hypothetical protein DGG95_03590 [Cytophagales bacterium]|jgi:hypothetical protein|nr:hypothetical protein [Cytophagales bacterium]